MLKITHLHKTFFPNTPNEKKALRGVNLTLEEGDFVTVIGSNGSGESTLMNCIAGVFYPDKGHILIDGVDVTRMPEQCSRQVHRTSFPRSDERNGCRYAGSRKPRNGKPPWQTFIAQVELSE